MLQPCSRGCCYARFGPAGLRAGPGGGPGRGTAPPASGERPRRRPGTGVRPLGSPPPGRDGRIAGSKTQQVPAATVRSRRGRAASSLFSLARARVRCSSWLGRRKEKREAQKAGCQAVVWGSLCPEEIAAPSGPAPACLRLSRSSVLGLSPSLGGARPCMGRQRGFYAASQHRHRPWGTGEQFGVPAPSPRGCKQRLALPQPLASVARLCGTLARTAPWRRTCPAVGVGLTYAYLYGPGHESHSTGVSLDLCWFYCRERLFTCVRAPPQQTLTNPYSRVQDRNHPSCRDGEQPQLFLA